MSRFRSRRKRAGGADTRNGRGIRGVGKRVTEDTASALTAAAVKAVKG